MRKIMVVLTVLSLALLVTSCATTVTRVSSDTITDLSGRWNDTDSQLVAEKIIDKMLNGKWLRKFLKKSGREPRIIVGKIRNKTDEHISVETFIRATSSLSLTLVFSTSMARSLTLGSQSCWLAPG